MAAPSNAALVFTIPGEKNSSQAMGSNGKKQKSRLENILFKLKKSDTDDEAPFAKTSDQQTSESGGSHGNDEVSNGGDSPSVSLEVKNGTDCGSSVPNRRTTRKPSRRERGSSGIGEGFENDCPLEQKYFAGETDVRSGKSTPEADTVKMREAYNSSTKSLDFENKKAHGSSSESLDFENKKAHGSSTKSLDFENKKAHGSSSKCLDFENKKAHGSSTKSSGFENIQIKIEKDDAEDYPGVFNKEKDDAEDNPDVFSNTPISSNISSPLSEEKVSSESYTFSCEKCSENFQSAQNLSDHKMNSHTFKQEKHYNSLVHPCCICGKSFSSQEYLSSHIVQHGKEGVVSEEMELTEIEDEEGDEKEGRVNKCSHCRRVFSTDDDFQLHKCSKGLMKPYGCGRCGRCFTHFTSLTSHIALHKGGLAQDLECYECGQTFMYSIELRRHVNVHIKADFTPVSVRRASTKSSATSTSTSVVESEKSSSHPSIEASSVQVSSKPSKLNVNESRKLLKLKLPLSRFAPAKRSHKRGPPKAHSCGVCGKIFYQRSYLTMHMKVHNAKQYECTHCDKKFTFKKSLELHIRIHTGERPYHCDICNKDFTRQDSLQKHQKIHLGVKPYVCETCGRQFADKFELQRHGLTHLEEKPHKCNVCSKAYIDKKRLNEHMFHHSGSLPFNCELCGKGFARKYRYHQHLRQHAGEVRYTCEVCNKGFFRRSDLNYHLQTHSGNRPYKCDTCGMGFLRESYLRRHMIVHSAVKPHKCSICEKEFARKNTLDRHLLMHKRKDEEDELEKVNERYNTLTTDFGYGITGDVAPLSVSNDEERDIMKDIQAVIGLGDDVDMFV